MSEATKQRPVTWEAYEATMARMISPEGIAKGLAFRPRPTDVVISPYSKSGTTWMQQIVHGLRTRGDMDFDDISRVVPWIETAHTLGIDLEAEQVSEPRAFKSHLPGDLVPAGARYIVPFRDPKDALVSLYHFMEGWFFAHGAFTREEFARGHFYLRGKKRDYWHHLRTWWARRDETDVMLLTFEGMKADLAGTVRRVAAFLGLDLDPDLERVVVEQASLQFMLAHKDRFDDLLMREHSERNALLPAGSDSAKVREGKVGASKVELSADLSAELEELWRDEIEAQIGFASYAEVCDALAQRI
ncbi:MAG: sulfotransferase domain-containing protein [Acidobacteriota bacterium]|nr:sulfotransferase domain-containing protein [Acidobacteriota bacterium]